MKSWLVGKEFNTGNTEGPVAGTPPLEVLGLLLSGVTTIDDVRSRKVLLISDVSRAFFQAPMQRNLYTELPEEDKNEEERRRDMLVHLNQSPYATRCSG